MSSITYNPYNLPESGTYLAEQRFAITGLLSGERYSLAVKDPVTSVIHNLSLSAAYQEYKSPKLVINYLNSEVLNTTMLVSGAQSIYVKDMQGRGLNPNVLYIEQSVDNWLGDVVWESYTSPKINAGGTHCLALTNTSKVTGWGNNDYGQLNIPGSLSGVLEVAVGSRHSLALTNAGKLTAWGENFYEQLEIPPGLSGVIAIAVGERHTLALTNTGNIIGWGDNAEGQLSIPPNLNNVTAIAAGTYHSIALTNTGTVTSWGDSLYTNIPDGLTGVIGIAAGNRHSLALTNRGTVVGWGLNIYGEIDIPPSLSGVTAIAAGQRHSLALTNVGTVTSWGDNSYGQTDVPPNLIEVESIEAGIYSSIALTYSGLITGWGSNYFGEIDVPPSLYNTGEMIVRTSDISAATITFDEDVSKWVLKSFRNVLVEESDVVVSKATKPWQVSWSDGDTNGIRTLVSIPLSGVYNNGSISLTFTSNEGLTSNNVVVTLDKGTEVIAVTGSIGVPFVFSNLDSSLMENNDITLNDQAKNRTWNLKVHIGLGDSTSYIKYNNYAFYQTGDTIVFPYNQANNPTQSRIEYKNQIYGKGDTLRLV